MSVSPLVTAIANRLRAARYINVPSPFRVASVSFDFTEALRGQDGRSLDLVLVIDTTTGGFGDKDPAQVRRRIEALSRALDVTKSRLVLTAILAGGTAPNDLDALSESCRVLIVEPLAIDLDGTPKDEKAERLLENRLRLLLPLEVPERDDGDGSEHTAMEALLKELPEGVNSELLRALIIASLEGEDTVTAKAAAFIEGALDVEDRP